MVVIHLLGYGAWSGWSGYLPIGTYMTDDNSVEITISNTFVDKIYGVVDRNRSYRDKGMSIFTHELGHHFGEGGSVFRDTDHSSSTQYHMGAGAFGRMNNNGNWDHRSSPYNPYLISGGSNNIQAASIHQGVDWIIPTEITSNQTDYTIPRLFQDTTLIRLKVDSADYPGNALEGQEFLIARYENIHDAQNEPPYSISLWAVPNNDALLIWHGNAEGVANDYRRKWADVESANGLTDWQQDTNRPTHYGEDLGTANPISGCDSLDWITDEYDNDQGTETAGSSLFFYCSQNNTSFLPYTNPNTNYIDDSSPYDQDVFTNLGISDITYHSGTSSYTADLWVDAPPKAPGTIVLDTVSNHPRVTWNASDEPDISGYYVNLKYYKWVGFPLKWQLHTTAVFTTDTTYTVTNFTCGGSNDKLYIWVTALDSGSNESITQSNTVLVTGVGPFWKITAADDALPTSYEVKNGYPNPFNPSTTISYSLPEASRIEIGIYNILGEKVYSSNTSLSAGYYNFEWKGQDSYGEALSTGIYFFKIRIFTESGMNSELKFESTQRLTLMK